MKKITVLFKIPGDDFYSQFSSSVELESIKGIYLSIEQTRKSSYGCECISGDKRKLESTIWKLN